MKTIDQSGSMQPIAWSKTGVRLTLHQELALLALDGHWKASNTLTATASTLSSLVRHGFLERAERLPSPAYPRKMWWYRLTEQGKERVRVLKGRVKHAKEMQVMGLSTQMRSQPMGSP